LIGQYSAPNSSNSKIVDAAKEEIFSTDAKFKIIA
jgi:hypothetical protein